MLAQLTSRLETHFQHNEYEKIQQILDEASDNKQLEVYRIRLKRCIADYDQALELSEKCLEQCEHNPLDIAKIHIERAYCFWFQANKDLANEELDDVQTILDKIVDTSDNYIRVKANYLHLRATSLPLDDFKNTVELLKQSIELKKEINAKSDLALSYNNLGYYQWKRNDFESAIVNLGLSFQINSEIKNTEQMALNLSNLIQVSIAMDNVRSAESYLDTFTKIFEQNEENITINRHYYYSKGLVFSRSSNLRRKLEAEDIFEALINSDFVSFSIYNQAIFNLCNLYIFQLDISYDDEVFQKLNEKIELLHNYGIETKRPRIVLKTEFLRAKVFAFQGNWEEAKSILVKVSEDAIKLGDSQMSRLISHELETLFKYEDILRAGNFHQRIDYYDLQEYLLNSVVGKNHNIQVLEEKPVAFIIMTEDGNQIQSVQLENNMAFNSFLFSSFISAISSFVSQVFGSKAGGLEKISHEKYTILLRKKEKLLYCYIYQGESNTSVTRMTAIIGEIHELIDTSDVIIHINKSTLAAIDEKIRVLLSTHELQIA